MLSLLRLERKQENSSNPFRIRIFSFLFYSFGIETINTFIHSRSSLENYTRFQTKMGKVQTRFQTKTAQKTLPDGAAHTYIAYVREYPPGLDFNRFIDYISAGMRECRLKAHYSLNHCGTMRAVDWYLFEVAGYYEVGLAAPYTQTKFRGNQNTNNGDATKLFLFPNLFVKSGRLYWHKLKFTWPHARCRVILSAFKVWQFHS